VFSYISFIINYFQILFKNLYFFKKTFVLFSKQLLNKYDLLQIKHLKQCKNKEKIDKEKSLPNK